MTPTAADVRQELNTATTTEISAHLGLCDASFIPPLSSRLEIGDYAAKLNTHAMLFEAWKDHVLIALVAGYPNPGQKELFITNVSVVPQWHGLGIATGLIARSAAAARDLRLKSVALEVDQGNLPARRLYEKLGFAPSAIGAESGHLIKMTLTL